MRLDRSSKKSAINIVESLEEHKLRRGFVIFRCTYNSQENGIHPLLGKQDCYDYF